jgi:hypothetical protein
MAFPFYDSTNKTGIADDIYWLTDTDTTSYPLADWEWDDRNLTTAPRAVATLVANQADYSLPTDMLRLQQVTVLDASGNELEVEPVSLDEYLEITSSATVTTGTPKFYALRGEQLLLTPVPVATGVTLASGLSLYISREADVFTAADTTQEAGIPEPFCRVLSLGPVSDYWMKYDQQKSAGFLAQVEAIKADLFKFNTNRVEDIKPRLNVRHNTRQYT